MASYTTPIQEDLLLKLYIEHIKKEIRDVLQPEVDRIVNETLDNAIEGAVKSLEVTLHKHYDHYRAEQAFKIILEKK